MPDLTSEDYLNIALGGTILGTGGGGSYIAARRVAERVLSRRRIRLVSLEDVPARARVVTAAAMGSPEAILDRPFTAQAKMAVEALEAATQEHASYALPVETSGFNLLACMTACAGRNLSVIDADGAGRSIPRLGQTLPHAHGIALSPFSLADARGRTITIMTEEFDLGERLALSALEHYGWLAGLACFPMTGAQTRQVTVPGTVSLARDVGAAVRSAGESGSDPLEVVLRTTGGTELIRGKIVGFHTESDGSYSFGTLKVRGTGSDRKSTVEIKSMNENMIASKDGRIVAVAPDRICYLRPNGQPVTNADVAVGDAIDVFVIQAQSQWRTPQALSSFSDTLRAMGYNEPYVRVKALRPAGRARSRK
jgi:uncharacterized protein